MSEQAEEQTDGVTSAPPRIYWTRPELARLAAGDAELGDVSRGDGVGQFS